MAVSFGQLGAGAKGVEVVFPASTKGLWSTANSDAETAQSAGEILRPLSATASTIVWLRVHPSVTRVLMRLRYDTGATYTTAPVVRLFGVFFPDAIQANAFADDGTVHVMRIDNVDSGAAGITIAGDATNDIRDTTYKYTDPTTFDGYDLRGASHVAAFIETAANISTGTPIVQLLGIN